MTAGRRPPPPAWGEPAPGVLERFRSRVGRLLGRRSAPPTAGLRELPVRLRRGELAERYLAAEGEVDHRRAATVAAEAAERAMREGDPWAGDVWAHRALWHFEQAGMTLHAVRQARRIGDLRTAAGDAAGARRYYAEAIDEARDIGAEHEQGLASLGLGRALLDLGEVTGGRRLAGAAETLLLRTGAPAAEVEAARALRGPEIAVGERTEDDG